MQTPLLLLTTREAAWFKILVDSVCMYVCLSNDNFRKTSHRKFLFEHPVYLQAIQVKFVYEGHRVKVKVTGPIEWRDRHLFYVTGSNYR